MKRMKIIGLILFSLLFFTVAAFASDNAVKIGEKEGLGNYLTDAAGMTLYWFKKDSPGMSGCMGPCIDKWPIFYREKIDPPTGLSADDFGTITRLDGEKQTTFRDYPLYYWIGDRAAGDTTGNGVGNVWFVIDPAAFPPW